MKRNHANHHSKIKDALDMEIQKIQSLPQVCTAAKQSISTSGKLFEQAIKCRKLKCLSEYIPLLNNEEQRIREQFNNEYNIPISTGSICNFNIEASRLLLELGFNKIVKHKKRRS